MSGGSMSSRNQTPSITPSRIRAGGEAEFAGRDEFGDARPQHPVGVEQPCQGAVQKALPQAPERPGPTILEGRRPMPVDVTGADRLVEQRFGLERREDVAAQ